VPDAEEDLIGRIIVSNENAGARSPAFFVGERAVLPVIASAAKQSISPREERNGLLRRKGSSQ
jgi:hypothetical protein